MKNGQLARAVCFQKSADDGNADYIEERFIGVSLAAFKL